MSAYEAGVMQQGERKPYDSYRELDLGEGVSAITPARETKRAAGEVISRMHKR